MPGYKAHLVVGGATAASGLAVLYSSGRITDPAVMAGMAGACLAGSLFPDVDTDSKAQRLFYLLLMLLDAWLLYEGRFREAAWLGLGAMLPGLSPHRGWTHSLWAVLLLPGAVLAAARFIPALGLAWLDVLPHALAFGAGLASHLLLDRLSRR